MRAKSVFLAGTIGVTVAVAFPLVRHWIPRTSEDSVGRLVRASSGMSRSIEPRLTPDPPEAMFNRGLMVERFGLRDQAREQWQAFVDRHGDDAWAVEAREHAHSLSPLPQFKEELARNYNRLMRDPSAARALAKR